MNNNLMFSSKKEDWETPKDFFEKLNQEFNFNLDPCASKKNHKCKEYFTKEQNGLLQNWQGYNVFVNPPYGRNITDKWVKKSFEESQKDNTLVVMLLPARTDTQWFHNYILNHCEIRFIKGRLKFGNSKDAAPFPSMIAIFKKEKSNKEIFKMLKNLHIYCQNIESCEDCIFSDKNNYLKCLFFEPPYYWNIRKLMKGE